jgi:hypothetical protein
MKRPSGKKRKIIGTGVLIVNFIFVGLKIGSAKIQSHKAITSLDYERVISNQELTSPETSDNPEKIIRTGGGIIIAFRQKAYGSSLNEEFNSLDKNNGKVILAKAEGNSSPLPNRGAGPSNFPSSSSKGARGNAYTPHVNPYKIPPKLAGQGLGATPNPGGAAEFDDNSPKKQSQESKTFDHDYRSSNKKKKDKSKDQCPINEQNKAGIDELPDSSEFTYNLETKAAKKALKTVWKNSDAKKEVLAGLDRMDKGELLPRNQKHLKGFKTLKEIKLTDTRMLVQLEKNGNPDQIVAIFMRRDLENIVSIFKGKYK